jgi:hypothetical protein
VTHHQIYEMAILAERARLPARAERGYRAESARGAGDDRTPVFAVLMRVIRGACVRTGLGRRDVDPRTEREVVPAALARCLVADKHTPTV